MPIWYSSFIMWMQIKITIKIGTAFENLVLRTKILSSSSVTFNALGESKRCFCRSVTANVVTRRTKAKYDKKFNQNNGFPMVVHFHWRRACDKGCIRSVSRSNSTMVAGPKKRHPSLVLASPLSPWHAIRLKSKVTEYSGSPGGWAEHVTHLSMTISASLGMLRIRFFIGLAPLSTVYWKMLIHLEKQSGKENGSLVAFKSLSEVSILNKEGKTTEV